MEVKWTNGLNHSGNFAVDCLLQCSDSSFGCPKSLAEYLPVRGTNSLPTDGMPRSSPIVSSARTTEPSGLRLGTPSQLLLESAAGGFITPKLSTSLTLPTLFPLSRPSLDKTTSLRLKMSHSVFFFFSNDGNIRMCKKQNFKLSNPLNNPS